MRSAAAAAYCVVVGVQVGHEDGGDPGQNLVHGVAVVSAELTEGSLAAVQQQRLTRAANTPMRFFFPQKKKVCLFCFGAPTLILNIYTDGVKSSNSFCNSNIFMELKSSAGEFNGSDLLITSELWSHPGCASLQQEEANGGRVSNMCHARISLRSLVLSRSVSPVKVTASTTNPDSI